MTQPRASQVETLRWAAKAERRYHGPLEAADIAWLIGIQTAAARRRLKGLVKSGLAGEKTVTRLPVKEQEVPWGCGETNCPQNWQKLPCRYETNRTYAIQPAIEDGPGKGRGGKEVARLFVVGIDREPLGGGLDWSISEAQREGFEDWPAFREYLIRLYGSYDPTQMVDRIEFELVAPTQQSEVLEGQG